MGGLEGVEEKTVEITDLEQINQVLSLLKKIPKKGDMMVKMGPSTVLKVTIFDDEEIGHFLYFDSVIKTLDTSFMSKPPAEQEQLHNLLVSLLGE